MDEISLVQRFQAGEETAFEQLYELYKNPALRSAFLITGNYADSENVLQETFLSCYQNLPKLKDPGSFKPWFYRILTRNAWRYCKKRDKETPVAAVFVEQQTLAEPLEPSVLELLAAAETQAALLAAIDCLPLKQKTVIILYYYDELSVQEIAQATGLLVGTVKSRLYTARQNLKKSLLELAGEQGIKQFAQQNNFREVGKNDLRIQAR